MTTAEGAAAAVTLTGSDPNAPPRSLTYLVTANPTHGTLSGTAPNLTYAPDAGYFGPDAFQFKVNNGTADSIPATVTLTVVGTPTANAQSVTLAEGGNAAITLTGADSNTPPRALTYAVTIAPAHGTLSGTAPDLTYTPEAGYFGPDSFQFTDTNGTATSMPAAVTIAVVGRPTADAQTVTTAQGTATAVTLTGTDPNTPPLALAYSVTTAPVHGILSGTAPDLTYTPDAGYFGPDSFQFTDTNGTATSTSATVTLTVVGTPTANAQTVTTAQGTAATVMLTGTDPNTPPQSLTYAITANPTHGTLSGTAPNLTYTPDAGYYGTDSFQFTDTNGTATSTPAAVTLTIVGTPTVDDQTDTVGENGSVGTTLTGTDPNSPALSLTYTITTGPTHGTLSGSAPNLTYTPDAGYFGSDSFQFTDTNGTATSAPATVSLIVVGTPTATAQTVTTAEGTAVAVTLAGTDPNTPAQSLTFTVTTGPAHGTLTGAGANLTYTPDVGYFGSDSFQFTATNGTATSTPAAVTLVVVGAPTADAQSITLAEGSTGAPVTLAGGDPNAPPLSLTYTVTTGPAHGTLSGTAPNLTYTPDAGYFGSDSFQFTDTNGTATSTPAIVSLTVVGTPTATAQTVTTAEGTAAAVTLTGTDPNTPTRPLSYVVTTGPAHGTLSGTAPNLTYTPDAGYFGSDSFQFAATNGAAASAAATVTLNVVGTPTADVQAVTAGENGTVAVTLTGTDPNEPALPLTFTVIAGPSHGTLSGAAPDLTYAPDAGYSGPDSFQFSATNGVATSAAATVSVTVNPANQAPNFTVGPNQTVGRDPGTVAVPGWTAPLPSGGTGPAPTFVVTTNDPGLFAVPPAIDPTTGTLTFTPTVHGFGTATVSVESMSGQDVSPSQTFTITVTEHKNGNDAPVNSNEFAQFVTSEETGGNGIVSVYNGTGTLSYTVQAFPNGTGVRATLADVNGDGVPDVIATTGPGVPVQVVVIDGVTKAVIRTFSPFETSFTGGAYVAAGDVNGDGKADIVVSADETGGPRVVVYDGATGNTLADFFGIQDPAFRGGARVAVGDVNGDGLADLIVSAGAGGGPRIAVYDGVSLRPGQSPVKLVADFFAFDSSLRDGAYVTAGDLNGDGFDDLIFGGGPTGGPRVLALAGASLTGPGGSVVTITSYFAGDSSLRAGVRLAAKDVDGDGKADLIESIPTAAGSQVSVVLGANIGPTSGPTTTEIDPDPGFLGGIFIG
ncbi:RTX toxin [Fimbriiglobus ruber]|uniref:RTX toxin n=1 Tax=Fimbriiglobus ruber TaxID=1908690 RepID=A0A225DED4_9BACT|nr:Ig-like domain-containing protein [Fimbriiglobus ruber]OWK39911.1 RTX toxin [Fimbriiglobus ruber]